MAKKQKQDGLVKSVRGLWPYIKPFKWKFIWALVLAGALTVVGLLPPLVMRGLVNDVASEGQFDLLPLLIGGLFGGCIYIKHKGPTPLRPKHDCLL